MELIFLLGLVVVGALGMLLLLVVVLPLFLIFKVVGAGARALFGIIGAVLGGLLLLPVALVVGGVLLAKLVLLAAPLLVLGVLVWAVVALTRRPAAV